MVEQVKTSPQQTKETYEAEVKTNFKWNGPLGIVQGLLLYVNTGLHDAQTVIPAFLYAITGSNTFVGLASTLGHFTNSVPQLFGISLVEHLPIKKHAMLRFGWMSSACWAVISLATFFLSERTLLVTFLLFHALAQTFFGLYLLVWTDVMSKVIPVEQRGHYFGVRNFLSTLATAAGVTLAGYFLATFPLPINYSLTFFAGFAFFALALITLAMTKEPIAWRVNPKTTFKEKIKQMPAIFKEDPNFFRFCCLRAIGAGFCQMSTPFYILFARQRLVGSDIGVLIGILGTTTAVSRAVGNLFWGAVAQRRGYKVPMELAFSIYALAGITALFSHTFPMFFLIFVINGLAGAGLMMSTHNILMEFGRMETRTTYIGISSAINGLIGGFAPLAGGFISDLMSYQTVFITTAIIATTTSVAMMRFVTDPRNVPEYH